jgi:hypothetical protein
MKKRWRCFHCDEVFGSANAARIHFGGGSFEDAGCVLKDYENGLLGIIREQAEQLERFRSEDSDLLRVIATMESDHRQALIRAEEEGYGKGVRDMTKQQTA